MVCYGLLHLACGTLGEWSPGHMLSVHFLGEVFLKTNKAEEHPMACAFQWVQTLRFSPSLSLGSEWPTPMCQEARFQACMPTQTGDPLLSVPFWKTMSIRQAWSVCQCKTLRNKLVWLLLTGCNSHGAQSVLPINLSSGVFRCLPKHPLDKNFWVKLYFLEVFFSFLLYITPLPKQMPACHLFSSLWPCLWTSCQSHAVELSGVAKLGVWKRLEQTVWF